MMRNSRSPRPSRSRRPGSRPAAGAHRPTSTWSSSLFAGQHVDHVEDAQRVERAEDHRDHQRRADQRQGHLEEHVHRVDAVDPRRLVDLARQHLQRRQDQQRHERRRLPDVDGDHRRPCDGAGIGGPGDAAGRSGRALSRMAFMTPYWSLQHPAPHLGRDDGRDRPGDQHRGAQQPRPGRWALSVSAMTRPSTARSDRDDGEDQRVADRTPPERVGQQAVPVEDRCGRPRRHRAGRCRCRRRRPRPCRPGGAGLVEHEIAAELGVPVARLGRSR